MKKKIAAAAAIILTVSLFSGCMGSNDATEVSEEISDLQTDYSSNSSESITEAVTENPDTMTENMPTATEETTVTETVSVSYLSEIMFIGDEMLSSFADISDMVYTSENAKAEDVLSLTDALSHTDKNPKYIYLGVGKEDLQNCNDYKFYVDMKAAISDIRDAYPDSMIAVMKLPVVKSMSSWDIDNCGGGAHYDISVYNDMLTAAVDEIGDDKIVIIDASSALADENGDLNSDYDTGDGVHLNDAGFSALSSYIENNRLYNEALGDTKTVDMPVVTEAEAESESSDETAAESETESASSEGLISDSEIKAERAPYTVSDPKVCYLTFDDGPSDNTPEILDILSENNIKATFFIVGRSIDGREDTLKRIADEGHTIGIHTYTHDYEEIYASVDAYVNDFELAYNRIYEVTGIKPWLFRFPGGSYNSFNEDIADDLIKEMTDRGFTYFDWSCATSDATVGATYDSCIENYKDSLTNDYETVLMHDSKPLTIEYLQEVIDYAKEQGYSFETLDSADPIQF